MNKLTTFLTFLVLILAVAFMVTENYAQGKKMDSNQLTFNHSSHLIAPKIDGVLDILYDQSAGSSGNAYTSQDFEAAFDAYDNQAADDFTATGDWTVDEVDVVGSYSVAGPAAGFNVYFYSNNAGVPGTQVYSASSLAYTYDAGTGIFSIPLTTPAVLTAGEYWVSVQARLDFGTGGQWYWGSVTGSYGAVAQWQNPGGGFGTACSTWGNIQSCIAATETDMYFVLMGTTGGTTVIPISQAIEDLDNDFVPDHLGDTVTVQGVVFSPNYQTTNNSFYISDGTAGTDIFAYGPPVFMWNPGDMLEITGFVNQYNGMTEIQLLDSTSWSLVSSGNPTPDPMVLTLAQYKANSELYEGSLVGFISLSLASGTWPAAGSSANLMLTDGADTVTFRIDSDTDIDGQPEPSWPVDVIGIGSQFDSSPPYNGGYQIFPRYYATDFLPPGTIPVELSSFTAETNLNSVSLRWNTATETNNQGFEIQRNSGSGFATVGFVQGSGTSTQQHSYSFVDQNLAAGRYTYRLRQVDFDGTSSFSSEVSVEIKPVSYSLAQNYPNPFNPTTMINFNLRIDSKVSLKVFNILGQEVAQLVNGSMVAGNHQINFDASKFNSGVYLYRLEATGIDGSTFSAVKKMMLTK